MCIRDSVYVYVHVHVRSVTESRQAQDGVGVVFLNFDSVQEIVTGSLRFIAQDRSSQTQL